VVFYAVFLLIYISARYGGLSMTALQTFWKTEYTDQITKTFELMVTQDANGAERRLFDDNYIKSVIDYVTLVMPSIVICIANVIAYLTTKVYKSLAGMFKITRYVILISPWDFEISIVSAYVYCITYAVSVLFAGDGNIYNIFNILTSNIILILTPGLGLYGVINFIMRIKGRGKNKARSGYIIGMTVTFFILLFINPTLIFTLFAFIGVVEIITARRSIKKSDK
jgi:hypothetical protein